MAVAGLTTKPLQDGSEKSLSVGPRGWTLLLALLLLLLTVAVYYPVHEHPFFNPDDYVYVTHNMHVQAGLTWDTTVWAFRNHYINWHPLTWIAHAAVFQLFGLNPAGHHAANVVLHACNAILLFWVLWRATGFKWRSLMVAALFAVHPINVEPVVWVAELKTMLSTMFFLLALGAYQWYTREPRDSRFWVVAGLFVLGLMAKPQVIALPFLLLLWDYWPLRRMFADVSGADQGTKPTYRLEARKFSWLVKEKLPLFALAAADALITMSAQNVAHPKDWPFTFSVRLENAIVSYVRYIGKAFWPARMVPLYPHPQHLLGGWLVLGALALLLAITAGVAIRWRSRYLTVGWVWFLVTMLPMIGLVQVGLQAMADRYAYQPFLGLFLMVCWGVAEWSHRHHIPPAMLTGVSVAVVLALAVTAHNQVDYWKDDMTIWSHTSEVIGPNFVAEYHLGLAFNERGNSSEAQKRFHNALALNPREPYINLQIGLYEHQRGNVPGAIEYYKQVLNSSDYEPDAIALALKKMSAAYRELGDNEHAQEYMDEANKLPENPASSQ